jgi:hypothetical protein
MDDEDSRSTDVYLEWVHDSDDPLLVRISPIGSVFGNRIGSTSVRAGAGDPAQGGVWARIPVDVKVTLTEKPNSPGGGFPELRVTDRDLDPETGLIGRISNGACSFSSHSRSGFQRNSTGV